MPCQANHSCSGPYRNNQGQIICPSSSPKCPFIKTQFPRREWQRGLQNLNSSTQIDLEMIDANEDVIGSISHIRAEINSRLEE